VGVAVVDDGADCGVVRGAHVEVLGFEVDLVAHLGFGLLPEFVRLHDQRVVVFLGIGDSDCAGLPVGGTTVVEEVELFEEKGPKAEFGGVVGGGAAHDASSHDDDVKLGIFHV